MIALVAAERYDSAAKFKWVLAWGSILALSVGASILIATGTSALLFALLMVVVVSCLRDRRIGGRRLLRVLPILIVGFGVQGWWMFRKPAPLEWNVPGYPAPYLEQLKVKDGNFPELGLAKWSDIPVRVGKNLLGDADVLMQVVIRHGVNERRVLLLLIPISLAAVGWAYSLWLAGGTDVVAWYFAMYEIIYLLWPFRMESRFALPVAPLALLYIWQGLAWHPVDGDSET